MNQVIPVTFLGGLDYRGYEVTYLLYEKQIEHDFIYIEDDYILRLHGLRDLQGFESIVEYLERYEYIADLWC
jgi:hypothetical protein